MPEQKQVVLGQGNIKQEMLKLEESELQQVLMQSNQWHEYSKQTALMMNIAQEMKEISELPSEKLNTKDTNPITKVEFPKEGGVLTYMDNYDYPYRGYPYHEFVDKIDLVKKTARSFVSGLYHQLKGRRLSLLTLLPSMWFMKDVLRAGVYTNFRTIERFRIKTERYSVAIKELHRSFSSSIDQSDKEFRDQVRDLVCMVLEFDNAYRFRFQDIIVELDKAALRKNSGKELTRLFELMQTRESQQEVSDTWKLAKYAIRFYLRFDKQLARIVKSVLLDLDLEKVKLTIEDKVYCIARKDYIFGFAMNPTEEDKKIVEASKLRKFWIDEREKVEKESTAKHQELMGRKHEAKDVQALDSKYESMLKESDKRYSLEKKKLLNDTL